MKINIEIDCEPEEVRKMVGLPDVTILNDALTKQIQKRIENGFDTEDMDKIMKLWFSGATTGFHEIQNNFWNILKSGGVNSSGSSSRPRDD